MNLEVITPTKRQSTSITFEILVSGVGLHLRDKKSPNQNHKLMR